MNAEPADRQPNQVAPPGALYTARMAQVRARFTQANTRPDAGVLASAQRARDVDALVTQLWAQQVSRQPALAQHLALVAVGGYGRQELLPYSDIDLLFLLDAKALDSERKDAIRRMSQALWDEGLRASTLTRTLAECERFDPENVEFTLATLDARLVTGDAEVATRLIARIVPKVIARDRKKIIARLNEVTLHRHLKYGDTLFHLEPNIKDCPGGLRDAHVCAWLGRLSEAGPGPATQEFAEAHAFLLLVRVYLHLRHGRDDNTLDWLSQDEAAAAALGSGALEVPAGMGAEYWMRLYFRHARVIDRSVQQAMEEAVAYRRPVGVGALASLRRVIADADHRSFEIDHDQIRLKQDPPGGNLASEPEVAFALFAAIGRTGAKLSRETESRLEAALPLLSAHLEDGPALWRALEAILTGAHAGVALRAMHALGILELIIPEFHGIDALVIRDAYHRYTVDEHTFVLIDTLHGLESPQRGPIATAPFTALLRDLPHISLLYLAALLHDTGKGHAGTSHAVESARMSQSVLTRLEIDPYESGLVLALIHQHLEMSAALRRDVFDEETIRSFASRVETPLALRMLTLFTYADICAVHPDALTSWKAENLYRLYLATQSFLDRNVDQERVGADSTSITSEAVHRIHALVPGESEAVSAFLAGFPRRYLTTRSPEQVRSHYRMAQRLAAPGASELEFSFSPGANEFTLVTADRPGLFAAIAGTLASWGMNIVTADAFSNARGIVVDHFRFVDTFRTLELNESERERFSNSLRSVLAGSIDVEKLLSARRRSRRRVPKVVVATRVTFDYRASSQSTLLEVVSQDTPGLLYALCVTFARKGCNIEVALVDTEGEMAIDVFYLTRAGARLDPAQEDDLRRNLLEAIEENAA